MSELIGSAELEIGVDLAPLDAGLLKAEKKTAEAMAVLQKMLDRNLNISGDRFGAFAAGLESGVAQPLGRIAGLADAAGARMVAAWAAARAEIDAVQGSLEKTAAVAVATSEVQVAAADRVTAAYLEQAAAARIAAGAQDAVIGRDLAADAFGVRGRRGAGGGGLLGGLAAIEGVRGAGHVGSRQNPMVLVLEAGRYTSLGGMAAAIGENSISGGPAPPSKGPVAAGVPLDREGRPIVAGAVSSEDRKRAVTEDALAAATAKLASIMSAPQAVPTKAGGGTTGVVLPGREAQQGQRTIILPGEVQSRGSGSEKAIPVIITDSEPKASQDAADAIAAALLGDALTNAAARGGVKETVFGGAAGAALAGAGGARGGSGGSGGGGVPPWLLGALWGSHGGGSRGRPPGWLGYLAGAGAGLGAGFGSIGSFAGFGPEHILLTAGGIAGSGVAALGGGALLGAGALGKFGVGAGSDAGVMSSTIADTKSLYTAYENLHQAIVVYGKGSEKAIEAQYELNKVLSELGHTAGVTAEEGLAQAARAMNKLWDASTGGARVQGAKILTQAVGLGTAYIPLVAHAAEQNLGAINKGLKPLFDWLKGPEGMGIFLQLEEEFRNEIPVGMAALNQGFQFFAKTIAYTAPLTGKFMTDLDHFFTKWNSPGEFTVWEGEINKLIDDFHVWGAFVKILGTDLVDLFNKDAHTGESIIEALTKMLDRVHEYEESTKGSHAISTIFLVHKEEALELLKALAPLISGFSNIYTTVAPPLVRAVTEVARGFDWLLETIDKAGALGKWVIGLTLIAAKLKVLGPILAAVRGEIKGVTAAEAENATVAGGDAAATSGLAGSEATVGAGGVVAGAEQLGGGAGLAGLLTKSNLIRGGAAAVGGSLVGSLAAGTVGARGTLGSAISAAGAGAGAGFVLAPAADALLGSTIGGPFGAALGAAIGFGTPYIVKGISDLFSSGKPAFQAHAEHLARSYQALSEANLGPGHPSTLAHHLQRAQEALVVPHPVYGKVGGGVTPHANNTVATREYRMAGEAAGKEYVEGFAHVRFPTRLGFLTAMEQHLNALPQQARGAAAKVMLQYAAQLEASGTLPKGVVASFITALEGKFTGLTSYLTSHGSANSAALAKAFELHHARETVTAGLAEIERRFGATFAHTQSGALEAIEFLQSLLRSHRPGVAAAAQQMLSGLVPAFETEWRSAREVNEREISKVNAELRSELKTLGAGTEVKAGLGEGKSITGRKGSELTASPFGGAVGGLIQIGAPGTAGRDSVPLNVGGLPVMVAPGEQVAVFNRHQLPVVNAALAGVGGLEGLFNTVTTPNYMAAGGLIPQVAAASVHDVRAAEKAKLARMQGASLTGHVSASGGKAGGTAQMRAWAKAGLEAAGVPATPGNISTIVGRMIQESGGNPMSINLWDSNAKAGHPSQGLMQTIPETFAKYHVAGTSSNIYDPVANVAAAVRYMLAVYGHLVGAGPGGYAHGGLLGFAKGGLLGFSKGGKVPRHAKKLPPVQDWRVHPFGRLHPLQETWYGQGYYNELGAIMGETGSVATGSENYELAVKSAEFALQKAPHEGQFVITPNSALGETGAPYIDEANVSLRRSQLGGLEGIEGGVLGSLNRAAELSQKVLGSFVNAITERHRAVLALQARIRANLEAIKKCKETIKRHETELKKVKKGSPQAKKLQAEIKAENMKIGALHAENQRLGGATDEVGTGGNIGVLLNQISDLTKGQETTTGYSHTIVGLTGHGGQRQQVEDTLTELGKQMGEIGGEALKVKIAEAGGGTGETSGALAEREKAQLEERLKIVTEENRTNSLALQVLNGPGDIGRGGVNAFSAAAFGSRGLLLPYGGSFAAGGEVPGPAGAPVAIIAHGGEKVSPAAEPQVHFEQHNHMLHPSDPSVLTAIGKASVRGIRYQGLKQAKRVRSGF